MKPQSFSFFFPEKAAASDEEGSEGIERGLGVEEGQLRLVQQGSETRRTFDKETGGVDCTEAGWE